MGCVLVDLNCTSGENGRLKRLVFASFKGKEPVKQSVTSHQQVFISQIKPEVKLISVKGNMVFIILDLSLCICDKTWGTKAGDYAKE